MFCGSLCAGSREGGRGRVAAAVFGQDPLEVVVMKAMWTLIQACIADARKAEALFAAGLRADNVWTGVVWAHAERGDLERPRRQAAA